MSTIASQILDKLGASPMLPEEVYCITFVKLVETTDALPIVTLKDNVEYFVGLMRERFAALLHTTWPDTYMLKCTL